MSFKWLIQPFRHGRTQLVRSKDGSKVSGAGTDSTCPEQGLIQPVRIRDGFNMILCLECAVPWLRDSPRLSPGLSRPAISLLISNFVKSWVWCQSSAELWLLMSPVCQGLVGWLLHLALPSATVATWLACFFHLRPANTPPKLSQG